MKRFMKIVIGLTLGCFGNILNLVRGTTTIGCVLVVPRRLVSISMRRHIVDGAWRVVTKVLAVIVKISVGAYQVASGWPEIRAVAKSRRRHVFEDGPRCHSRARRRVVEIGRIVLLWQRIVGDYWFRSSTRPIRRRRNR